MLKKFISEGAEGLQTEQQNTSCGPFFCFPFRLQHFLIHKWKDLIHLASTDKVIPDSTGTSGTVSTCEACF